MADGYYERAKVSVEIQTDDEYEPGKEWESHSFALRGDECVEEAFAQALESIALPGDLMNLVLGVLLMLRDWESIQKNAVDGVLSPEMARMCEPLWGVLEEFRERKLEWARKRREYKKRLASEQACPES